MEMRRVRIAYESCLHSGLIAQMFVRVRSVTFVEPPFSGADAVEFPLTDSGSPVMDILPRPVPRGAKLVAVLPGPDPVAFALQESLIEPPA